MTSSDVEAVIHDVVKKSALNLSDNRTYKELYKEVETQLGILCRNNDDPNDFRYRTSLHVALITFENDTYGLDISIMSQHSHDQDIYLFYSFEDFVYQFVVKRRNEKIDDLLSEFGDFTEPES